MSIPVILIDFTFDYSSCFGSFDKKLIDFAKSSSQNSSNLESFRLESKFYAKNQEVFLDFLENTPKIGVLCPVKRDFWSKFI